ncbi:MAG TPA: hypothetical protein VFM18_06240 [Methanosarcina sp.]|nr:hypothetical protein [Methanosarcina sp.]
MARQLKFEMVKTYATEENAVKAVQKLFGHNDQLRFAVFKDESSGRYYPMFFGMDALKEGVHFHFHVSA